jgi:hypothetical protein
MIDEIEAGEDVYSCIFCGKRPFWIGEAPTGTPSWRIKCRCGRGTDRITDQESFNTNKNARAWAIEIWNAMNGGEW